MAADIERIGLEQWAASAKRQAALRLLNNMRFSSAVDRDQCLQDIEIILGESLE
jgi:hypothetical protein